MASVPLCWHWVNPHPLPCAHWASPLVSIPQLQGSFSPTSSLPVLNQGWSPNYLIQRKSPKHTDGFVTKSCLAVLGFFGLAWFPNELKHSSFLQELPKPTATLLALNVGPCSLLCRRRKTTQPLPLCFGSVLLPLGPSSQGHVQLIVRLSLFLSTGSFCSAGKNTRTAPGPRGGLLLPLSTQDGSPHVINAMIPFLLFSSQPPALCFLWDTLSKGLKWRANCHGQWQLTRLSSWMDHRSLSMLCFSVFSKFSTMNIKSQKEM